MLSRRAFVSWISGTAAAIGIGARPRPSRADSGASEGPSPAQPATLDAAVVTRVAEVVLPSELGDAGIARAGRAFTQWVAGYRPGAELNHAYGSTEIRHSGGSPAARWKSQLASLEREARGRHKRGFIALTRDQRRELIVAALGDERLTRMPDALSANHVAIALMSWYYGTPDANDLCYRARIGRNSCRPLVNAAREPLPLATSRPGAGGGST